MTRSPSYLRHNRYGYYFRMRVPQHLKKYLGKTELKCALQTGYLFEARSKAAVLGGSYKQLFKWVQHQNYAGIMKDEEIQEVVNLFIEYIGEADLYGEIGIVGSQNL
mgnify:CR=1 FL=1